MKFSVFKNLISPYVTAEEDLPKFATWANFVLTMELRSQTLSYADFKKFAEQFKADNIDFAKNEDQLKALPEATNFVLLVEAGLIKVKPAPSRGPPAKQEKPEVQDSPARQTSSAPRKDSSKKDKPATTPPVIRMCCEYCGLKSHWTTQCRIKKFHEEKNKKM